MGCLAARASGLRLSMGWCHLASSVLDLHVRHSLLLRDLGLDPTSERAQRAVGFVRDCCTWGPEFGVSPFFEGEVEPCINGRCLASGAYFGEASDRLLDRLHHEQLEDGGWNCYAPPSKLSSFHSTICVLERLLEYEQAKAQDDRPPGRSPSRAGVSVGTRHDPVAVNRSGDRTRLDAVFLSDALALRCIAGPGYLRSAGVEPDERVAEAIDLVERKRDSDGRWPLENSHAGQVHFDMEEGAGTPSRWNTLRGLRVLD